jgi:exodeoxyribonuclease VII small subunit
VGLLVKNNKLTFEEALKELELSADKLKKDGVTLEEAINSYEEGIKYYNQCSEILNDAKQKIEIISK